MRVFISYRRSDSKDVSARIADNLSHIRAIDNIFLDVEAIEIGEHFPERLDREIGEADVVLAVIGPNWDGGSDEHGEVRIRSEADFVRRELARALEAGKRVIPCLVNDADMPSRGKLPPDLVELADRNALTLRHTSFRQDSEALVDAILQRRRRGAKRVGASGLAGGFAWRAALGLILAMVVAVLGASISYGMTGKPLETLLGGEPQLLLLMFALAAFFQFGTYRFLRQNT